MLKKMNYLETVGQIGRHKEVDFRQWFSRLSEEDQSNVRILGNWLLGVIGERGEVWAVGSSVRNVRRGKDALGDDIDLQVYARCPNQAMIRLLENALNRTPPPGFVLQKEPRFDNYTGESYFNAELFPASGRAIHLLSPKPWEMTPEEEIKFRWGIFRGPFARFEKVV